MQNTTWYNLNKPDGTDAVDVSKLNENMDTIDQELHKAQLTANNQADAYDDTETYSVGDLVIYGNTLYKCTTDIITAEAWTPTHWTPTTLAEAIAAGGGGVPAVYYSTEEHVIGTWIDGRPVYEKSYDYMLDSVVQNTTKHLVYEPGIKPLSPITGYVTIGAPDNYYELPYNGYTTRLVYNPSSGYIDFVTNDYWSASYKIYMTVRYIKNAD